MNAAQLPRHIVNQLLEQTLNAGNAEICGLIASRNGIPSTCYPVANVAANTDSQFQLEPKQQINAMRTMRETGQTLFAIYHSHPKTPATPSKQDIEQANYPDTLYLIISMATTGSVQLRGFRIENKIAHAIDVTITEDQDIDALR